MVKNKKNKASFKSEFNKLWIHGLTHLFGYDHKKDKDFYKMNRVEKSSSHILMIDKLLNNRFFVLFIAPFSLG